MIAKKNYVVLFFLFLILTTYAPKNTFFSTFFKIKEIVLSNNSEENLENIFKDLEIILGKNITFLSEKDFEFIINKHPIIREIKIKKIYPSKVELDINQKKVIGIIIDKKEKKIITDKNEILKLRRYYDFGKLPFIYGGSDEFIKLYNLLNEINFPIEKIKVFYYFEIGRWDLELINNKLIKLPPKNVRFSLQNFIENYESNNFEKFDFFDYRIKNELIIR